MRELASGRPVGRLLCFWWLVIVAVCGSQHAWAATPVRTQVVDTFFRADGTPEKGTLLISWPAFATASGDAVAAGQMSTQIGADGKVSVWLIPNTGSMPQSNYRVTVKLSSGVTSEEYWTVPAATKTTIAAIRSKVVPAVVAQQFVGRDYVDTKFAQITGAANDANAVHKTGNESIDGVKQFLQSPVVPAPQNASDAANKGYVDGAAGIKASVPNTFTAPQKFNQEPVTPLNVQFYGAMGVAGVDYAAELQAALNASIASGAKLYFPCGQYNTSKMLTYYGGVVPGIEAENPWCARISYTGTADVAHTLELASGADHANYISGGGVSGITVEGNSHVTVAALGLYRLNNTAIRDVFMGPASATTGACMYVLSGVANHFSNIACNQGRRGNWDSLKPKYGFVFDGVSPWDQSTTSTIDVPTIQGVSGIALWMKVNSIGFVLNSCQIGSNGQAAQIDGSFHMLNSCLFEASSSATSVEVAGQSNTFVEPFFSESSPQKLSITGRKISFHGGYASSLDVVVTSSARNVSFDGVSLNPAKLTDGSPDTRYDNLGDAYSDGGLLQNFATHKQTPPGGLIGVGNFDAATTATGSWSASSTTPVAIFPNAFATGKAWRAYFIGQVVITGIQGGAPRWFELTDANNSIATFGSNTITFSVDGTTGQFMMASSASYQGFAGTIWFVPTNSAAGSDTSPSMQLAGTLKAPAVQVTNGAYVSTLQAGTLSTNSTLTLPATTDTLVGRASTDTLTNKTIDTAGAGNVLKIAGTQVSAVTGSGSVVLQSGPTITGMLTLDTITSSTSNNLYLTAAANKNATLTSAAGGTTYIGANGSSMLVSLDGVNKVLKPSAAGDAQLGLASSPWKDLYVGTSTTANFHFASANTASRTYTWPDSNITVSGAKAYDCGTTTTCANTNNSAAVLVVSGVVTLASGTATVSGISPAFTSTSSFVCTGTDQTSVAAVKIANSSTSSITLTGTGTDVVGYHCVGI